MPIIIAFILPELELIICGYKHGYVFVAAPNEWFLEEQLKRLEHPDNVIMRMDTDGVSLLIEEVPIEE